MAAPFRASITVITVCTTTHTKSLHNRERPDGSCLHCHCGCGSSQINSVTHSNLRSVQLVEACSLFIVDADVILMRSFKKFKITIYKKYLYITNTTLVITENKNSASYCQLTVVIVKVCHQFAVCLLLFFFFLTI